MDNLVALLQIHADNAHEANKSRFGQHVNVLLASHPIGGAGFIVIGLRQKMPLKSKGLWYNNCVSNREIILYKSGEEHL